MRNQLRTTENNPSPTSSRNRTFMPLSGFLNIFDSPFAKMQDIEPKIEVSETKKNIMVTAELPGINEKDIDLQIFTNGYLTISGEKRYKTEETIDGGYFSEISYGHFSRTVPLPRELDYTKASAEYTNGILTIAVPKANLEQSTRKKIAVNNKSDKKQSTPTTKRGRRKKQS